MMPLTVQVHQQLAPMLKSGDICVDATAGNGHDTLFLAQSAGQVYGLDIQELALDRTRERLQQASVSNVYLIRGSHAHMETLLPPEIHGNVACIMFNLGYLPGGDKSLITRVGSTIAALQHSLGFLRPGGLLSIVAYPGHAGGADELNALLNFLDELPDGCSLISSLPDSPLPTSPRWFLVSRRQNCQ